MMENNNLKYELVLNDTKENVFGKTLYRIKALIDLDYVRQGELGGYIEGYHNLSQEGNSWVCLDGIAHDEAFIGDDSVVIRGTVSGNVKLLGRVVVETNSLITDNVVLNGNIIIRSMSYIDGNVQISGECIITDCYIQDDSVISNAILTNCDIKDKAHISNTTMEFERTLIGGEAVINSNKDYFYMTGGNLPESIFCYKTKEGIMISQNDIYIRSLDTYAKIRYYIKGIDKTVEYIKSVLE